MLPQYITQNPLRQTQKKTFSDNGRMKFTSTQLGDEAGNLMRWQFLVAAQAGSKNAPPPDADCCRRSVS